MTGRTWHTCRHLFFFFLILRLVASPGSRCTTSQRCPNSRSFQWSTVSMPQKRCRIRRRRWKWSQDWSRRMWTERRTITGEVTLSPQAASHGFPALSSLQLSWAEPSLFSRFFILGVHRPVPVQALVCPLLAVWNGEEEGGRERTSGASGTCIGGLLTGGKTPSENHRERQPGHLPDSDSLHHRLLGLTGMLSWHLSGHVVLWEWGVLNGKMYVVQMCFSPSLKEAQWSV